MTVEKVRASEAEALRRCPGKKKLEKGQPDIQTKESEQGTRLHLYTAHPEYDRRLLPPNEQDLLRLADKLEEDAFEIIKLEGEYDDFRESYLSNDIADGHPDLVRVYTTHNVSVISERKFGWTPVDDADVNIQTRIYAMLSDTPVTYVMILQPRRNYENRITLAKYESWHKLAARSEVEAILRNSEAEDAPLVPGEQQCRYCRARSFCPALREAVTKQLAGFEDLSVEIAPELSKLKVSSIIAARLANASDKELGQFHRACGMARVANDQVNDEIRRRVRAGGMEGYSLSKEVDVREIADPKRAISKLVLTRILTKDDILGICDLPIGRVEAAHRKKNDVSKKVATADINRVLESVIAHQARKPRIIPPKEER